MKLFKNIIIAAPIILSLCVGYPAVSFPAEKIEKPDTLSKKSKKPAKSINKSPSKSKKPANSINKSPSKSKKSTKSIKKSSSSTKKSSKLIKKSSLTRKKSKSKSSLSPARKQKKLSTSSLQEKRGLKIGYCNTGRKIFRLSEKVCGNRKGSFHAKLEGAQTELRRMNRHSSVSAASLIKKRNRGLNELSPQVVGSGLLRDGSGPKDPGQFEPDLEKDVRTPLPAGIDWGKVHGRGGPAGNDYIDAFFRWIDGDIDQRGTNDLADGPQDGGDSGGTWHMRGDGEWQRGEPPGGRGWDPLSDALDWLEDRFDDIMGDGRQPDPGHGLTPEEIGDLIGTDNDGDDDDSSDSNDGTGGNTNDDDDNDDGNDDDSDDGDDGDDGDDSSDSDSGDSGDDEGDDTEEGSEKGQPTGGDRGGRGGDGPSLGAQLSSNLSVDLSTGRKKHQRVTGGGDGGGHISTPVTQPGKGDEHRSDTPDIQTEPEDDTRTGEGVRPVRQHGTPDPGVGPNAQPGVDYEEDGPVLFMNNGNPVRLPDWIIDDPRVDQ